MEIQLTKGFAAIVDDEDADLAAFKWHAATKTGKTPYAARSIWLGHGKLKSLKMHRVIAERMFGTGGDCAVDHINGDGLDNRRANLRQATAAQNNSNRSRNRNSSSGYKGVSWMESERRWRACIQANGKVYHLGVFGDAIDAALAYDAAARAFHKEFARLNFQDGIERGSGHAE